MQKFLKFLENVEKPDFLWYIKIKNKFGSDNDMDKRLYKSTENKMICGVCGGIAEYFNVDPTLIRLATAALTLFSVGSMVIAYFVAAIIIPEPNQQ